MSDLPPNRDRDTDPTPVPALDPAPEWFSELGLDPGTVDTPDPLYFQQASMLMLAFRFKGSRKVVASRLMAGSDFLAELTAHLPVLEENYGAWEVSAVEVVSYQRGAFYYDPWPGGLELARAYQRARRGGAAEPGAESGPDDEDAEEPAEAA